MSNIGTQIAQLRAKRGLSIRQLANLSGVNYTNIGKLERGEYNASIEIVEKILTALDAQLTIKENDNVKEAAQ